MEIKFDPEYNICMLELNSLSALKNIIFLASSASKLGEVTTVHFVNNLKLSHVVSVRASIPLVRHEKVCATKIITFPTLALRSHPEPLRP